MSNNQQEDPQDSLRSPHHESLSIVGDEPQSHTLASRLLDLAVTASLPRGSESQVFSRDIPRQMNRAMSQITRLHAQRNNNSQRLLTGASLGTTTNSQNQIALYAESLLNQQRNRRSFTSASVHPSFRSKPVCTLLCRFCDQDICQRGMKAILLADTKVINCFLIKKVELYSTDRVGEGKVQLVANVYMTRNCHCKIRDVACLGW
jgi:hypothetical protein